MKRSLQQVFLLLLSLFAKTSYSQEFREFSNGLIYDEQTMSALRKIVDSQNIQYRKCDLWKNYFSIPQAFCNTVFLDSSNIQEAIADIKNNVTFVEFCKKYPRAVSHQNLLVLRSKSDDYKKKNRVVFHTVELDKYGSDYLRSSDSTLLTKLLKNTWAVEYQKPSKYSSESITAFYFTSEFTSVKIPNRFSQMIQYVDCLIDTNSTIVVNGAQESYREGWGQPEKNSADLPKRYTFNKYIAEHTDKPKRKLNIDSIYYTWLDHRDSMMENVLSKTEEFQTLLKAAIVEAIQLSVSDDEIEWLSQKYDTKEHTLQLKRSRIVVGGCSQDSRPRVHAQEIAVLAAETTNWEIFLRAHLDIVNDRFERVSDGSYAWEERNTYIKELEKLNIDVSSLLIGTAFRIDNPSGNHYWGSIGRLGRALSESKAPDEIEQIMTSAIQSDDLDNFNRVLIYYLYRNYTYQLTDKERKLANAGKLQKLIDAFPPHIRSNLEVKQKDFFID